MGLEVGGLVGLLVLIANIWAILNIIGSSASVGGKLVWIIVLLLLPVVGLLIWLIAGPRAGRMM
jgi:Phospholipase_D-nuclease N-terminal